jgi:ribosomal protein L17
MSAIIRLCAKLPFDSNAIKQSEIGKHIKKLQKYSPRSSSSSYTNQEVTDFIKDVDAIMESWREQLSVLTKNKQSSTPSSTSATTTSATSFSSSSIPTGTTTTKATEDGKKIIEKNMTMFEKNRLEQSRQLLTKITANNNNNNNLTATNKRQFASINSFVSTTTPSSSFSLGNKDSVVISNESKPFTDNKSELTQPMERFSVSNSSSSTRMEEANESKEEVMEESFLPSLPAVSTTPAKPAVVRERKPLDMIEGARKLLAMRSQQVKAAAAAASANNNDNTGKDIGEDGLKSVFNKDQKPLAKGGLKKKDATNKKQKQTIKWADDEGGLLREIHTIEVEKIKSTVANYKSHKDLVKKEKQLEKETHLMKTTEAMQRTTDWRLPKPFNLSITITDNIGKPTGSIERDIQNKRIANVLEAR